MPTRLATALLAAALVTLPVPALAADTVRPSAPLEVHTGPGERYAVIGILPTSARVELIRCTRKAVWCLFRDTNGEPGGWVRGGYLIGIGAISRATPFEFLVNPGFSPLPPP